MLSLNPEEFLNFLTHIKITGEIKVTDIELDSKDLQSQRSDTIKLTMKINNRDYFLYLNPIYDFKLIAAFIYYKYSEDAQKAVHLEIFNSFIDFFNTTYVPYVKNDTGFSINEQFKRIIETEIEALVV